MPLLTRGTLAIDHTDEGAGPPVVLIHSSVSGNRQWRALSDALKDRYRVLAINLFGYGQTTPWPTHAAQSLYAQAQLVLAVCEEAGTPVHLVGHSFGGSVALKAASLLGPRVASVVLLEPNPASLLKQARAHRCLPGSARPARPREVLRRARRLAEGGRALCRLLAGRRFVGRDVREAPRGVRRVAAAQFPRVGCRDGRGGHHGAMAGHPRAHSGGKRPRHRLPVREIVQLFQHACPHWRFEFLPEGGHMAPLTRPELVNPLVAAFLDAAPSAE
jgi:pimeloyl-ACP methyl ester carboxylesterase